MVLRARLLDRPQRLGAPQIVAPIAGSTQDRITIYGCCISPLILKPLRSSFYGGSVFSCMRPRRSQKERRGLRNNTGR
jgi:hypothetical protein